MLKASVLSSLVSCASAQDVFLSSSAKAKKPNLVWFITDDQDQLLGGSFPPSMAGTPMPKTKALMQDGGVSADNWYIHTPICSPSRAELLTGRYFHNVKATGGKTNGMHVNYTYVNDNTFARNLQDEGYTVGMFGKYLNLMPKEVPPGFDAWMANGGGHYMNPEFDTKNVADLGDWQMEDGTWTGQGNYSTAVIGNVSIAWIKKVAHEGKPFMAYIGPKSAHGPFNPAPWYVDAWDPSWPDHEPRDENWNCSFEDRADHPSNVPLQPMITDRASRVITGIWKNRWRTLMSVDDLISDVIATVDELGLSDSTYFFYSTDHGFQLGQLNIPFDKRHVYEWDTKIHLLGRGPGIKPGSTFANPGTQVDLAPTLLGLAGADVPEHMDGKSIVPFILDPASKAVMESTRKHLNALGDVESYAANWREEVFIEHYFVANNIKCMNATCDNDPKNDYPNRDSNCVDLTPGKNADCWCTSDSYPTDPAGDCYATEDDANNFIAIRSLKNGENTLYAEYQRGSLYDADVQFDQVDFVEYYDLDADGVMLQNLAKTTAKDLKLLSEKVQAWYRCSGKTCP
jgi:N-acetylglucosamine-6-sulfatase